MEGNIRIYSTDCPRVVVRPVNMILPDPESREISISWSVARPGFSKSGRMGTHPLNLKEIRFYGR